MNKLAKSSILAIGLFVSAYASAANPVVFSLGNLETTDSISHTVGKPSFSDIYNFTLGTGSTYDLVFDLNSRNSAAEKFSSFSFKLFSGTLTSNANLNLATVVSGSTLGNFTTNLSASGLAAGNYSLNVFGKGKEDDSRYLTGSIGITTHGISVIPTAIPAVPEPESYAMMLAGLGLMGTIARRRKQKNTSV